MAVTKGKTIQVSHTCTYRKTLARPLQVRDWCRSGFQVFYNEVGRSSVKLLDTGSIHNKTFISLNFPAITRTTHAHDALRRAAPVRMCVLRMQVGHGAQGRLRLNRT